MFGVSVNLASVYLVVEYRPYNFQSLLDARAGDGLSHLEGLEVAKQVASALQFIHCKNMSHRDIKPDNILLLSCGQEGVSVKVCDFGLSKSSVDLCRTGDIGTPSYMAPELLATNTAYQATKVDVRAFGVLFYYIWTRKGPYEGIKGVQILRLIMDGVLLDIPENCPQQVRDFLVNCWETDPEKRPTMDDVLTRVQLIQAANLPPPT
jgi:serine/threonine protein kinase